MREEKTSPTVQDLFGHSHNKIQEIAIFGTFASIRSYIAFAMVHIDMFYWKDFLKEFSINSKKKSIPYLI